MSTRNGYELFLFHFILFFFILMSHFEGIKYNAPAAKRKNMTENVCEFLTSTCM